MGDNPFELAAAALGRSAGLECDRCGRPHATVASLLVDPDPRPQFCACGCCEPVWASAASRLRSERRVACEKRNHAGLRCSPKSHHGADIPVTLDELRMAVGALEADLEQAR